MSLSYTSLVKCLYIDLASHKGLLALVTKKSVTASDHVDHRMGDQELIPRVERVLGVGGWVWEDLTHVACVIGPGGFMSLRVGVALANTLADQLGIPVAGVHLSDVYRTRWQEGEERQERQKSVVWLHSTKKTELFVRGFGEYARTWPVATHVTLEDFVHEVGELQIKSLPWIGELISEHQKALAVSVAEIRESPLRRPEDVLPEFLQSLSYKKQILEPWYGRGW